MGEVVIIIHFALGNDITVLVIDGAIGHSPKPTAQVTIIYPHAARKCYELGFRVARPNRFAFCWLLIL